MALTTLDPHTALIVIDLQQGMLTYATVPPIDDVVQSSVALLAVFRRLGLPVVLVTVAGTAPGRTEQLRPVRQLPDGWLDLLPALQQQSSDHTVVKRTWGAFTGTDLAAHLTRLGVTQVVLAGVATSVGVESTARQAYEHGFNVTLAIDAMTDTHAEAHSNSITRIFPRLGETGTSREIIALLEQSHA